MNTKLNLEKEKYNKNSVLNIQDQMKQKEIIQFESLYPQYKENLNSFFKPIIQDDKYKRDIDNIKYIIYTSKEEYKLLFLDNIKSIHLYVVENIEENHEDKSDKAKYYDAIFINTVKINLAQERYNPRGPYTTFFHECAHGIDDVLTLFGSASTHMFDSSKKTLRSIMRDDCKDNIINYIKTEFSDVSYDSSIKIMISILDSDSIKMPETIKLNTSELKIRNEVIRYYKESLKTYDNEAVSDIYGGLTSNVLRGNLGHIDAYWNNIISGKNRLQKELFAEYYSYMITGNLRAINSTRYFLPNSCKALDEGINKLY